MSDCCAPSNNGSANNGEQTTNCCAAPNGQAHQARTTQIQHCPTCGKKGKKVEMETVKSMMAVTLHEVRPDSYYLFCRTADCAVVYFAEDGEQTFIEDELREKVYQKHLGDDDVFVCYCFRHTAGSIRAELLETGRSMVVETVTAGTKVHQCACETRNPQGSCGLGNVRAAVQHVRQEVEAATSI